MKSMLFAGNSRIFSMQLPWTMVLVGTCCWIVFVFMWITPFCVVSRWVGAHCAKRREWVRLPRPRDAFREGPEESHSYLFAKGVCWARNRKSRGPPCCRTTVKPRARARLREDHSQEWIEHTSCSGLQYIIRQMQAMDLMRAKLTDKAPLQVKQDRR